MIDGAMWQVLAQTMVKHLPPSASTLRLVDMGSVVGDLLRPLRADLEIHTDWGADNSADAVTAYDIAVGDVLLAQALRVLRPGGRLILVQPEGEIDRQHVDVLEAAGYTRILVETLESPLTGVLIRGEKPHVTADTLARVEGVARLDSSPNLSNFRGRYVHLLVRQTPNKPVWALTPDDHISWEAVAVQQGDADVALAFSSLPNAVSFLQAAVLAGTVHDVNRVAKFSRQTAAGWSFGIVLNPTADFLNSQRLSAISIDPATAETPDE